MDGSYAAGLGKALLMIVIIVAIIVARISWVIARFTYKRDSIESKTRINPEIRLTTDGKRVDTIFVYKQINR